MRRVDRWEADDGSVWDTPGKALERDGLLEEIEAFKRSLNMREVPNGLDYANGEGYIQQPPGTRDSLVGFLKLKGWNRDSTGPIGRLGYVAHKIDDQDREWGQPYFALNPHKAKLYEDVGS